MQEELITRLDKSDDRGPCIRQLEGYSGTVLAIAAHLAFE